MKQYEVLTGTGREYFDTLDDAVIFAKYINGVVVDTITGDRLYDFYNV